MFPVIRSSPQEDGNVGVEKKHGLLETAPEKELDTGPEKEDEAPPKGVMADEDPPNGVRVWLKFTPPEPVAEEGC